MTDTFKVGDTVARRLAPSRPLKIVSVRDGQFILTDLTGAPKGGCWASDLVRA